MQQLLDETLMLANAHLLACLLVCTQIVLWTACLAANGGAIEGHKYLQRETVSPLACDQTPESCAAGILRLPCPDHHA
jgi:hypothetical protein